MARVPFSMRMLIPRRRLDLRRAFTHDFPLKATAVLIAVLFWIAAGVNSAPVEVTQPFGGRVAVERPEVPPGYVLEATLGDVGVTLRGLQGPVSNVVAADLHANLEMAAADLHRSDPQEVPVRVTVADSSVKVVEVSPAMVTVRMEPVTARTAAVQLRLANDPPQGTFAGDAAIAPGEVRVSGALSKVALIAAVYATVRFGDSVADLIQSVQPVAVDASAATIDGLTVEPAVVQVTVPVLPTATTRTVPLLPTLRGAVASGYWITRITVDPPAATVRGEATVLGAVDHLDAVAVDVTGLTGDRTFQAPLVVPGGTSLLRPTGAATITVSVSPLAGTRAFPIVAVQATNLGSGLLSEIEPQTIGLVLTGPVPALAGVTAGQVIATVDATARGPGTYAVEVAVHVPAGTTAQSVQPTRVTLTIRTR